MNFSKSIGVIKIFIWITVVGLGISLVLFSTPASVTISYILGILFILGGLIKLTYYLVSNDNKSNFKSELAIFTLAISLGIMMVIRPAWFLHLINEIIGILITIKGSAMIKSAIEAKKQKMSGWGTKLILAITLCALGIMLIVSLIGTNLLMIILGILLTIIGVSSISFTILNNKAN